MNLENLITLAMEGSLSHDDMTAVIKANIQKAPLNVTEKDLKALVGITAIYFGNEFEDGNPLELFSVLKKSNFDFKGVYEPLNKFSTEQYVQFIAGDFEVVEEQVEQFFKEKSLKEGDGIAIFYNNEFTYMYVDEIDEDGNLITYSRKYGKLLVNPSVTPVRKVAVDTLEDIVAQVEWSYSDGETIYLRNENAETVVKFVPVKLNGKLHIYDKMTNEVKEEGYDSLVELMSNFVKEHPQASYVEVVL